MTGTEKVLLVAGAAGLVALAASRTDKGAAVAADVLGEISVAATKVGTALGFVRGIRNNNPGNIDWIPNPDARWRGMIRKETRDDVPPGVTPRFGIFDTAANGVRAIGGELRASIRKGHTIRQAINEWAPPVENDTGRYVTLFAKAVGAHPDARLTSEMIPAGTLEIIRHENGQQPYDPAAVHQWVNS